MSTQHNLQPIHYIKSNISREVCEATSFLGWKLYVVKDGKRFIRIFADKDFGGEKESLAAARQAFSTWPA